MRGLWVLGLVLAGVAGAQEEQVKPMAAGAHPAFEVATIKASAPDDGSSGFHLDGHRIFYENETVLAMVQFAYQVHGKQVLGLPEWCSTERLDVQGVPDADGQPSWKQQQEMLRKLLADRFGLKLHRDKKEMAIFALTVGKGGAKLPKSAGEPDGLADQTGNATRDVQDWRLTNSSMVDFVQLMDTFVDKPIVDQTGLTGRYDFALKWAPNVAPDAEAGVVPGLFQAVQEELGLRLEGTRGLAEVLVVDGVKRPLVD